MTTSPEPITKLTRKGESLSGSLYSELHLVLQTHHAQLLVRGRDVKDKPLISGLLAFADRMRLVWQAAEADDPFADWFLVKVHDAIVTAEYRIETESKQLKTFLNSSRTMSIAPAEVKEPFRMALRFTTPYGYRAARVLGEFDDLVCHAYTARQIGKVPDAKCEEAIRTCARRIRGVFSLPQRFRRLGLARSGGVVDEPTFERAEVLMGSIPRDILDGSRRAPWSPKIRGLTAADIPPAASEGSLDGTVFE